MRTFSWSSKSEGSCRHCLTEWKYPLQHALWVIFRPTFGIPHTIKLGVYLKDGIDFKGDDYDS